MSFTAILDPRDCGVTFDGITDDTAAWNAAVVAAVTGRKMILMPGGRSRVAGPINIPAALRIAGCGRGSSALFMTGASAGLKITTPDPVTLQDFSIIGDKTRYQVGVVIDAAPDGAENAESILENLYIGNVYCGVRAIRARETRYQGLVIEQPDIVDAYGLWIDNLHNPDNGDSFVASCYLTGSVNPSATRQVGIMQTGAGGLKIVNTKFLGHDFGYLLEIAGVTSDLLISNSSFEQVSNAGIGIGRQAGGTFANVVITGNQFAVPIAGTAPNSILKLDSDNTWLSHVGVVGNCTTPLGPINLRGLPFTGLGNY